MSLDTNFEVGDWVSLVTDYLHIQYHVAELSDFGFTTDTVRLHNDKEYPQRHWFPYRVRGAPWCKVLIPPTKELLSKETLDGLIMDVIWNHATDSSISTIKWMRLLRDAILAENERREHG